MEEEKAIWSSKEKALTDAMEEKMRLYNIKIESLSTEMAEVCLNRKTSYNETVTEAWNTTAIKSFWMSTFRTINVLNVLRHSFSSYSYLFGFRVMILKLS